MQYILEEKEYQQLVKWQKIQEALTQLEKDLRPIFDRLSGNNCFNPYHKFEATEHFKAYTEAFERFAKSL